MSSYGLECYDSTGNSVVKVTDRLTRVLFTKEVAAGVSGNQNLNMPPGTSIVVGNSIDVGNQDSPDGVWIINSANDLLGIEITPSSSGYLDKITINAGPSGVNDIYARGVVIDADTTACLSVTDIFTIDTTSWYDLTFIDKPYLNSGQRYYLAVIFDMQLGDDAHLSYSSIPKDWIYDSGNFFRAPTDLNTWTLDNANPPCIFGTYTDQFYSGDISKIFGYSYPLDISIEGMSHSVVITTVNSTTYNVAWYPNEIIISGTTWIPSVDSLIIVMGY